RGSWISNLSSKFSSSAAGAGPLDGAGREEEKEKRGVRRGLGLTRDRRKSDADDKIRQQQHHLHHHHLGHVHHATSTGTASAADTAIPKSGAPAPRQRDGPAVPAPPEVAVSPISAWSGYATTTVDELDTLTSAAPTTSNGASSGKEAKERAPPRPIPTTATAASRQPPVPSSPSPSPSLSPSLGSRGASPQRPGFFRNALRKMAPQFASGVEQAAPTQLTASPVRRVMNVDRARDRSLVPELKQARLRRVAFCVDIEVAGIAARDDAADGPDVVSVSHEAKTKQDTKMKAMKESEGAALKAHLHGGNGNGNDNDNAEAATAADAPGSPPAVELQHEASTQSQSRPVEDAAPANADTPDPAAAKAAPVPTEHTPHATKKQEKKKRSEEERKERKERRHRQAEMNGTIPLHFVRDTLSAPPHALRADQPTTDPVRIYRRCCALRETGVLKRMVAEISAPSSRLADEPGTVASLNLSGFKMKLEDLITFGDWLAVVPVRKLILQDCGLNDDTLRTILSALLATKPMIDVYEKPATSSGANGTGSGVGRPPRGIQKLILNDNKHIGPEGWKHIALFVHMSRTLIGIDLSGIPFPSDRLHDGIATIFADALRTRLAGDMLNELVLSDCDLSTEDVQAIAGAAKTVRLKRLGLANNGLTLQAMQAVMSYCLDGACEGLDLGGNDLSVQEEGVNAESLDAASDYEDSVDLLSSVITSAHSLTALSLADCNLTPSMLDRLLRALATLPNLRFIDLSHNRALFAESSRDVGGGGGGGGENDRSDLHSRRRAASKHDAVTILRKYLPRLHDLRRVHLVDVSLTPDAAIALAEILPDCPRLCHINILENPEIASLTTADKAADEASQETACAVYASLMTAVRISDSLFAVDIEVPSVESNEVIKALAEQIVAYSLYNLQRSDFIDSAVMCGEAAAAADNSARAVADTSGKSKADLPVPEVLLHIVGGDDELGEIEPAPSEDYVITGTGVVKALGVFLGNLDHGRSRSVSRRPLHRRGLSSASLANSLSGATSSPRLKPADSSPLDSGSSTPRRRLSGSGTQDLLASRSKHRPKESRTMSKNLLNSARLIRARLQTAAVRAEQGGSDLTHRRLLFLEDTLGRMIGRFEDEFPDCRPPDVETARKGSSEESAAMSEITQTLSNAGAEPAVELEDGVGADQFAARLSRSASNTSLHSRWLTSEEGRMHRVSQHVRRDILGDAEVGADASGAVLDDDQEDAGLAIGGAGGPGEAELRSLREKIRRLSSPSRPGSRSSTPAPARSTTPDLRQEIMSALNATRDGSRTRSLDSTSVTSSDQTAASSLADTAQSQADTDTGRPSVLLTTTGRAAADSATEDQALEDSLAELLVLRRNDPESFETFRQSQIAAQINAGMRNLHQLAKPKPWRQYEQWAKEFGPVYSLVLGTKLRIMIASDEAVKDLLDKRASISSARPDLYIGQQVLSEDKRFFMSTNMSKWRLVRKLVHTVLNITATKTYIPYQDLESKYMIESMIDHPDDFFNHLRRYAASLTCQMVYGFRCPTFDDQRLQTLFLTFGEFTRQINNVPAHLFDVFPILRSIPEWLLPLVRRARAFHKIESRNLLTFWLETKERLEEGTCLPCFSYDVLRRQAIEGWDDETAAYISAGILTAGSDTSSAAQQAFIAAMALNPEVQARAQKELDRVVGLDRLPTFDDYDNLPYIRCCIKECLRWCPLTLIGLPHVTTEDQEYMGYLIPKGSILNASIWTINNDEKRAPNPRVFDPDRHKDDHTTLFQSAQGDPKKRDCFSFGAGRRQCPGIHIAERSVFLGVSRLLWGFNMGIKRGPDGKPISPPDSLELIPGLINRLVEFAADIKPRDEGRVKVIRQAVRDDEARLLDPKTKQWLRLPEGVKLPTPGNVEKL
ncbi:hypothetical protein KEM52_001371, partial [Ascosphaera acerosa]